MLHIQLLGRFSLWHGEKPVIIRSRSVQELLCFLLLGPRGASPRERVASELWGDRSTSQSLKQLSQSLWLMKTLFEEEGIDGLEVSDPELLRLELKSDVSLDTEQLGRAYSLASRAEPLTPPEITELRGAVTLYSGDLLEGWIQDWCLIERERYRDEFQVILDRLVGLSLHQRDIQAGLGYARRILTLEPARERTHRQMMELHLHSGDRTAALRQFESCTQLLSTEFGVGPSDETLAVWHRARNGDGSSAPPASPDLCEALRMVNQVAQMLLEVKRKLEDIR